MGCACGGRSAYSAAGAQRAAEQSGGGGGSQWEVTYNDGGTQTFATEAEALGALAHKGGGYRQVPR
jgi:hypothetical protein